MVNNPKQEEVISSIKGIYVVDAGAGSGKTYTITKRYLEILKESEITPKDILLLTFTNNAASNMKDKILNKILENSPETNVMDSNISTFHSFCKKILNQHCKNTPEHLGITHPLNQNYYLSEKEVLEKSFFKKLYNSFKKNHPEYDEEYRIINSRFFEVLYLIRKLLSKGIFPKRDGWFLNAEEVLKGTFDEFTELATKINTCEEGARGPKQSWLLSKFKGKIRGKLLYDLPEEFELNKQVNPELLTESFNENREQWMKFVHDIYFNYIETSVKENRLTFDFLIMFTFLELYHNKSTREKNSFEYVMIDEFQDTNEMQFMLSLLLMKTNNLCVVGDWKQGIYGFRNATIENITDFQQKLVKYKEILNQEETRIEFDITSQSKDFDINFRSSQKILDFSTKSLLIQGSADEFIDADLVQSKIVELTANFDLNDNSKIEFYQTKDKDSELDFILKKIQELISTNTQIREFNSDGTFIDRSIMFKDIAILSRTRTFGLNLQELGQKYNIPINYEGGIELFSVKESILLLSVLRILINKNDKKGWIALLDYFNYSLGDKKHIIKTKEYPQELLSFRNDLFKYKRNIIFLISKIFEHFKIKNCYSDAIIQNIGSIFNNNLISLENLIYFIEENISAGETYSIDINTNENAITIQTIHGSKGLEYPVVFIVNCNEKQFPSNSSEKDIISLNAPLGLRSTKQFNTKNEYTAIFDNWKTDLVKSVIQTDYDEERRLLFVAITRAKQYVFLTSSKPSTFFKELQKHIDEEPVIVEDTSLEILQSETSEHTTNIQIEEYESRGNVFSVHDLMTYNQDTGGKGIEFGNKIHDIAEKLAKGLEVSDATQETLRIKEFLKNLNKKELIPEIEVSLYLGKNLIRGTIDLLVIYEDKIEIIDYKTDTSKLNHEEYKKQLSVYYHAVSEYYKLPVIAKIFYVSQNEIEKIPPISKEELTLISNQL